MKEFKLYLNGLTCANCGNKIERKVDSLKGVEEAVLNFSVGTLTIELKDENDEEKVTEEVKKIVKALEPDVIVEKYTGRRKKHNENHEHHHHHGEECHCGEEHHHEHHHGEECHCVEEHDHHEHHHGEECHCGEEHHHHEHHHGEKCHCKEEHHHHESEESSHHNHGNLEEKKGFDLTENIPFIAGLIIYVIAIIMKDNGPYNLILFLVSYILIGGEVIVNAVKNIAHGELFDENFLMTLATIGAFAIGEYTEAVAVMVFYKIGEMFQDYAVNKSRKSISSLMDIRADYANKLVNNKEEKVSPEEVEIDDIIVIKPGERVPLDGIVLEGEGSLDTSALTGESVPRDIHKGEEILSGAINLNGLLKVKVTKEYGESTVSRILDLVENAGSKKAPTEKFITKFSKYYTPVVVIAAVILAIVPPLVISGAEFSDWLYRALIFLVVSCPCALVISVPLGLFAGIGAASTKGILVKGGNYLEAIKDTEIVVFDKTGTLTKGVFNVVKINPVGEINKEELLEIAAMGESFSNHPIGQSIVKAYSKPIDKNLIKDYEEISGNGIKATIKGKKVLLGNYKLMKQYGISCIVKDEAGTIVNVAIDGEYKGYILIADEIKETSKKAIEELKKLGIKKTVMLTGDNKKVAEAVGKNVGVDEVCSELLPEGKVEELEKLLKEKSPKGKLIFVGDGINDAPVLARADIGVAMGGIGSDAAIEVSDVVLMKDDLSALTKAVNIAKKTNKILWQNITFSLIIKAIVLVLGALGLANIWEGVFADVGVTLLAVLNSMRALKA